MCIPRLTFALSPTFDPPSLLPLLVTTGTEYLEGGKVNVPNKRRRLLTQKQQQAQEQHEDPVGTQLHGFGGAGTTGFVLLTRANNNVHHLHFATSLALLVLDLQRHLVDAGPQVGVVAEDHGGL